MISLPLREAREIFERDYLVAQINRFGGNISRTAAFIGMERSALHRKLKSLGVGSMAASRRLMRSTALRDRGALSKILQAAPRSSRGRTRKCIVIPAKAGTQRLQSPELMRQRSCAFSNTTTLVSRFRGNDNFVYERRGSAAPRESNFIRRGRYHA